MSTCVEDVFPWVYQGGEGLAQGCLHTHGLMYCRIGPHTHVFCAYYGREYSPLGG